MNLVPGMDVKRKNTTTLIPKKVSEIESRIHRKALRLVRDYDDDKFDITVLLIHIITEVLKENEKLENTDKLTAAAPELLEALESILENDVMV